MKIFIKTGQKELYLNSFIFSNTSEILWSNPSYDNIFTLCNNYFSSLFFRFIKCNMSALSFSRFIFVKNNIGVHVARRCLSCGVQRYASMVYKGKTQPNLLPVIGADCLLTNFLEKNIVSTFSRWNGTTVDANNTGSQEHIDSLLKKNKVVVFMKGIPSQPMCGFSNAVVQILRMHGVEYDSYNVLEDDALRSGIKEYSDWPTIPQVYMNGEFIGGCDILLQMHQSGDLIDELKSVGIRSALLDKK
ncbi:uncharacterized protein LOC143447087 [Clavelina lepadiformis]|uniref:uncharacterized protein LOC143447087 n=1 Tax=Clavelina lepadiformis TaxID=159417 RepID=UPI0040414D6C